MYIEDVAKDWPKLIYKWAFLGSC